MNVVLLFQEYVCVSREAICSIVMGFFHNRFHNIQGKIASVCHRSVLDGHIGHLNSRVYGQILLIFSLSLVELI